MKAKTLRSLFTIFIVSFMLTTCDFFGTINATVAGLVVSMQVTNKAARAGRSLIGSSDTVELYLERFAYIHDDFDLNGDGYSDGGFILIVANGDMTDDDGHFFNNAGWYDASTREWQAKTLPFSGAHNSFELRITKIKINGIDVYDFPDYNFPMFGKVQTHGQESYYLDNFSGIFMPGPGAYTMPSTKPNPEGPIGLDREGHKSTANLLETILTVEAEIVDNCFDPITRQPLQTIGPWNLSYDPMKDPYRYIKVEGIVHEW
jgi:hypothetical protein